MSQRFIKNSIEIGTRDEAIKLISLEEKYIIYI